MFSIYKYLFLFSFSFSIFELGNTFFLNIQFGNPFRIAKKEINKKIEYNLPKRDSDIIKKLNGFYGMIGPDVNTSTINTLYDLFTGDGNIQGIFFDNGELTYTKNFVRTEKLLYEEVNGRIPNHWVITFLFMTLEKTGLLPNMMGMANTAILNIENNTYALFERDLPYLLDIDYNKKNINTVKKVNIKGLSHFSGHSKYINNKIETIDYHILTKSINYFQFNKTFDILNKKAIYVDNLPITHDFIITNDNVILTDSPFSFHIDDITNIRVPVKFDKKKPTNIHIINKTDFSINKFTSNESFYIFHYADLKDNDDYIDIYAPVYEDVNFSKLSINGKYRKISINKLTKEVKIIKNELLEKFNLDFPIKYKNKVILRNIYNNTINGFVICENLYIKHILFLKDKFISGEPAITEIDNIPYLISFGYNSENSYLIIIDIENYKIIEIPLNVHVSIGFHSIFTKQ
jgi:carotenoid cleavage dioxygenase-like enzyme